MNPLRRPLDRGARLSVTISMFVLMLALTLWFLIKHDTAPAALHWAAVGVGGAAVCVNGHRLVRFWRARPR